MEMMELFNAHGWTVFYMSGLVTGFVLAYFVMACETLMDIVNDYFKEKRKKHKELQKKEGD